jgi:hypothetical protein
MNEDQVKNLLQFIDATQSEETKEAIFSQLGRDCFYCNHHEQWLEQFEGNPQAFLDRINVQQTSKYWESLVFSDDEKTLVLTGRKVESCACAFALCSQPPKSLCYYCCKHFQQEYFKTLFGRDVEVEITSAFLLGDERCNTVIYFGHSEEKNTGWS